MGSIIVNEDYTISPMDDIRLRSDPIVITVTLLRDGVVEVLPEDIILTLVQDSRTESNNNQLLIYDTIRVILQDNDSMSHPFQFIESTDTIYAILQGWIRECTVHWS